MDQDRLVRDFTYHPPTKDNVWKFEALRNHAKNLALLIDNYVPDSREKSLAITNLEQAVFWANAGIARNQEPDAIAGAMAVEHNDLEDSVDYPEANLVPLPLNAQNAIGNIQTLVAESKDCGGVCKCKRF